MFIKTLLTALSVGVMSVNMLSAKDNSMSISASVTPAFAIISTQDSTTILSFEKDSVVNIPFGQTTRRTSVNDITVINPSELLKYDNISDVASLLDGRIPGLLGGLNLRGLGSALIVIDGVPRSMSSISINEIEQITVLKDANASMLYGVMGSNGVILIKTKRGKANKRLITGSLETGYGIPLSFPDYLGSAEYMELFNEARLNDGLVPLYTPASIDAVRNKTNTTRYPDIDYYNSEFLKNSKPTSRMITEFSGGNNDAQYYLNLGWMRSGSIMNKGGSNLHDDRLNIRSNIDFRVNKMISSNIGIVGIFNVGSTATGDFFNDAANLRPNLFPSLIDTALVTNKTLLRSATLVDGKYLVGGTSLYRTNPYGYLNLGGFNKNLGVAVQFNNGLNFDLGTLAKGLSFKTNVSFDFTNSYIESQTNTYAVYQPTWTVGSNNQDVLSLTRIGADLFSGALGIGGSNLNRKIAFSGILDYSRTIRENHAISLSVLGYVDKYNETGIFQSDKHSHVGTRVNYAYANKYLADFSTAISSSAKLAPGNRIGVSPSIGLGWIVSEENFLKDNTLIDFLKLRASAGMINSDAGLGRYYAYEDIYSQSNGVFWNDGIRSNSTTILSNKGNKDLFYEKRKEFNVGLEALLFNRSISLDATLFREVKSDIFTDPINSYPAYLGGLIATENFGENRYSGFELGLNWNKSLSNLSFDVGPTLLFMNSEVVKRDEYWGEDYLYRAGRPISAIYGLEAMGLFQDAQDIANHPAQEFGVVQAGDIKYKDQNNDDVVNADDQIMIGNGAASFVGGLNLRLKYKNISLFTLVTAQNGSDRFYSNSYYWVYGDRKFSEVVRNRWTPETASTATYPRLTSQSSSNNFRTSTYWLYDNSVASIDRIQVSYDLPVNVASRLYTKTLGFYIRANNVANFSHERSKMELNIGSEPQYRSYLLGLKALF